MSSHTYREVYRIARRVERRAMRGAEGRSWYADRRADAVRRHGVHAPRWLSYYAACSHHTSDTFAQDAADDALALDLAGRPFPLIPERWGIAWRQVVANLERVRVGEPVRGPKLRPFESALHGDSTACVVDRWMMRCAGFEYVNLRRAQGRRLIAGIEMAARRLGWSVTETQAAAWTAERGTS